MEEIIMKKIALLLALLLCMVPVLSSCGANSSAKKAAVAAFEAYYVDSDPSAYFEVCVDYNVDLLKEYIDSDAADAMKESVRASQDSVKETIKSYWDSYTESEKDGGLGAEDVSVDYEVLTVSKYNDKTEAFDKVMAEFTYDNSDIEDVVKEVAIVEILTTIEYTIDDDDYVDSGVKTYYCYNIDGDWYVG